MSNPEQKINLTKAVVLIADSSAHALDVTGQMLKGFGVAEIVRCERVEDAEKALSHRSIDLIIIDPSLEGGAGYDLLVNLRRGTGNNAHVPIILLSGHVRVRDVSRARDTGANFVIAKPLSAAVLLERILWVGRDNRPFVEIEEGYVGPDRRFKFEGPPVGSDGRRENDLKAPLGEASEPNMSQLEVDAFIKPQRVAL